MDEVRDAVPVPFIGDDADVAPLKGHDIPRLPLGDLIGVDGQAFGISLKKHPQIGDPAEIDVGIGRALHPRVKPGIFGDIGINERLEVVPGVLEGPPHHIGADAPVLRRVTPGKVAGVIGGVIFGILPGPQHQVGVIVDAVAVGVQRALQRFNAEMLRGISSMGQKIPIVQPQQNKHKGQHGQKPRPAAAFLFFHG